MTFQSKNLPVLFLILLCVFVVFSPVLKAQFLNWDDDVHLLQNPFLQPLNFHCIRNIFTTTVARTYIPVTLLGFAVELHFFGANPFIFHLNNLLLHLAVTAGIFFLARALGLSLRAGAIAALIFGLHPMHVESVAWVTERKDVLYSVFYLAAVLCYIRYVRIETRGYNDIYVDPRTVFDSGIGRITQRKFVWLGLALFLGVLSALSKAMALSLPFILLLVDWFFERRASFKSLIEKFLIGALLFPVIWLTYVGNMRAIPLMWPESLCIWSWCFIFHLQKFFFPDVFLLFYPFPRPLTFQNPSCFFAVLAVFAVVGSLWVFRKKRIFLFAFFWYFLSVFFLLRFDWAKDANFVADRFMYLPSAGLCIFVAFYFDQLLNVCSKLKRQIVSMILVFILLFLAIQSFRQAIYWQNSVSFWRHQLTTKIERQPRLAQAIIYSKYAQALSQSPEIETMIEKYKLARFNQPQSALDSQTQSRLNAMLLLWQKAIRAWPKYPHAYFDLGVFYERLGEIPRSKIFFKKAIECDPKHFEALYHLGRIYIEEGSLTDGVETLRQAVAINPDNVILIKEILGFYSEVYRKTGNPRIMKEENFLTKELGVGLL